MPECRCLTWQSSNSGSIVISTAKLNVTVEDAALRQPALFVEFILLIVKIYCLLKPSVAAVSCSRESLRTNLDLLLSVSRLQICHIWTMHLMRNSSKSTENEEVSARNGKIMITSCIVHWISNLFYKRSRHVCIIIHWPICNFDVHNKLSKFDHNFQGCS